MKIDANGINMNYELNGKGTCLVLIHGFSDNLTMWYNQAPEFSRHYQVIAYDFRGHGKTETPEREFSMELFADDLYALLKALNIEKAGILGYSMGGRIGLEFALKYPEIITGLIMANITVAGKELKISEQQAELMGKHLRMMTRLCESGNLEVLADELVTKSLSPEFQEREPQILRNYKEIKLQNDPMHYSSVMQAMIRSLETPPDLTRVECPVLLIAGEHDPFLNLKVVRAMERDMARSVLKILPAGHAAAIEAPDVFNKTVLEFMKSL
ncbi:alpha/beta fold hydrolase [Thermodesulfobacteriota bacterium]